MYVNFIHPVTGEARQVKLGYSWTLFFFGMLFGIPFFIRKMYSYGIIICLLLIKHIINIALFDAGYYSSYLEQYLLIVNFLSLGVSCTFFVQGNKMTAKYYLTHGFRIKDNNEHIKQQVKIAWGFTDDVFIKSEI